MLVDTPTRLDARQEELLRELAAIRGEETPDGQVRAPHKSVFGRLRDAFTRAADVSLPVHLVASLAGVAAGATVEVTGDEAHHAVAVRRLREGEQVVLTDGRGTSVVGAVASTGKRVFAVTVELGRQRRARPEPAVTVVQALPKGDRGELAVEVLTEVGVDRDRAVGRVPLGRGVEGRAGREVAREVAGHRPRGRQAVAPRLVPRR